MEASCWALRRQRRASFPFHLELISHQEQSVRGFLVLGIQFSPKEDSGVYFHMASILLRAALSLSWSPALPQLLTQPRTPIS